MKKIFSPLFLTFTLPLSILKKSKLDNFLAGLIFGAIFSLIVNIATVQIQQIIDKQRTLEALEAEILWNGIVANGVIDQNSLQLKCSKTNHGVF